MLTNDLTNHRTAVVLAAHLVANGTMEQQAVFEEWCVAQMALIDQVNIFLAAQYRYLQLLRSSQLQAALVSGSIYHEGLVPLERAQGALQDAHNRAEMVSARLLEVTREWLSREQTS